MELSITIAQHEIFLLAFTAGLGFGTAVIPLMLSFSLLSDLFKKPKPSNTEHHIFK